MPKLRKGDSNDKSKGVRQPIQDSRRQIAAKLRKRLVEQKLSGQEVPQKLKRWLRRSRTIASTFFDKIQEQGAITTPCPGFMLSLLRRRSAPWHPVRRCLLQRW